MHSNELQDVHIVSCIVFCRPAQQSNIIDSIEDWGLQANVSHDAPGKLVVLIEAETTEQVQAHMQNMQIMDGVLTVTMVYHHVEQEKDLRQEMICP